MIAICFGTRPEYLKVKPIIEKLGDKCKLIFTGQHKDLLKEVEFDYMITTTTGSNRLDSIVSSCIFQFPEWDYLQGVLVQGDTASAFGCALAAFHRKLKVIYVESGLRSYNLEHPYPEEGYRQMISRIADINFAPTELSLSNLELDNVEGASFIVGNTVLDNLVGHLGKLEYQDQVLITMHRRENLEIMDKWFHEINSIAKSYPNIKFTLPIHPNPEVRKHMKEFNSDNLFVIDPLPHKNLIDLMAKCKLIITDSGGLQEEGSFFQKKVIVCRRVTERPEGIKPGFIHLVEEPRNLKKTFDKLIIDYKISKDCPYGDGYASDKILHHLKKYFDFLG